MIIGAFGLGIKIILSVDGKKKLRQIPFDIHFNENAKSPRWECPTTSLGELFDNLKKMAESNDGDDESAQEKKKKLKKFSEELTSIFDNSKLPEDLKKRLFETPLLKGNDGLVIPPEWSLNEYVIYSLEESRLRSIDDKKQIRPLGNRGEGLLPYLKELSQRPNGTEMIHEINENLKLLDWFDELSIPSGQLSSEVGIRLHDNYLRESLEYFDQRSTNEGFLYLLFYLTLIISDETPDFFAIENIDASFNPKLCKEVTRRLIELAKKHNKQIITTTHNPAILDALDLEDEDVKLHVVRRSVDGHTKINSVDLKSKLNMPLSRAWTEGLLGGLPNNF